MKELNLKYLALINGEWVAVKNEHELHVYAEEQTEGFGGVSGTLMELMMNGESSNGKYPLRSIVV
jgi:hypothetical protein